MTGSLVRGGSRNTLLIARREYADRVRTRTFVAATAIIAFVAVGLALAPIGLRAVQHDAVVQIGVTSPEAPLAGTAIGLLDSYLNHPPQGVDPATWLKPYRFERVSDPATGLSLLASRQLDAVLEVRRQADLGLAFRLHTADSTTSPLSQRIGFAAEGIAILDWQARLPSDPTVGAFHPPAYEVVSSSAATDGGSPIDQAQASSRSIVATALIVLIFINLTIYGMWVATSVAAEKSSRVMELLISAATPRQLLLGKVLGVGGAGMTQYLAILLPAGAVVLLQDRIQALVLGPAAGGGGPPPLAGLTLPILGAYGLFFLLGFVFYALLYAAAGSMVSRQEDVQQLALPLSAVTMASYVAAVFGLGSIGSPVVVVLSFVPFSSPFLMLARLMLGRVAPWEVALSAAILVASSVAVLLLAARIYAAGVLLYGQRPGLRAFIRAARSAGR